VLTNDEPTYFTRQSAANITRLADADSRKIIDFELGRKALEEADRQKQPELRKSPILIDPRPDNAVSEFLVGGSYLLLALALLLAFALLCG
jgi:hypothetical protein